MRIKNPALVFSRDCTSIVSNLTNKLSHVKSRTAANYHFLTILKFNTGVVFCQKLVEGEDSDFLRKVDIKPLHIVYRKVVHESESTGDANGHHVQSYPLLYHRHT